jgi:type IV pilus assembly protein PilQ
MNGFIRLITIGALVLNLLSCASSQPEDDEALTTQSYNDGEATASGTDATAAGKDEFADFDKGSGDAATAPSNSASTAPAAPGKDGDLALEDEVNQASPADKQFSADDLDKPADMQPAAPGDVASQETPAAPAPSEQAPAAQAPEAPAVQDLGSASQPVPAPEVVDSTAKVAPSSGSVEITGLKYKANDAGGTVVIESNGPVTYTTRVNPDLKQYVIEIPNSTLPKRLKRTLNTRDIKGAVGAVDAYQSPGSNVSRIVVQLRDGYSEPVVQQEGNSLLVVTAPGEIATNVASKAQQKDESSEGASEVATGEASASDADGNGNVDMNSGKILASQSLEEYLAGNTKFYGRKISIETSNIDVRDALKFVTEESGVNMVITDEVKGNISLKIRQVPWDQALIVIMKARKLGYSRQGNVLRIAPLDELKKEEDDATKLAIARKNVEPLKVRAFSISYAKVDEMDKKIKDFLTERGKVVSDIRTNTIVVTDIEDSLNRVAKLIKGLDSAPPQVLIEGKVVEASDSFTRSVGVNWNFTGSDVKVSDGARGPVNMHPSLGVGGTSQPVGGLGLQLALGTLDILGDLTSTLALYEKEEKVKVLSSPRIVTLTNEKADISTTNEYPVRTITPQANGAALISYQFKPLTLKLEVTPQVTNDGTVIMKVAVMRQIKGAAISTTDDTFSVNSREANTRVIVKNGQTAVIGGIYRTDITEGVTGVPWLKDIPFLGGLFRASTRDRQRSELLIFLTPRILAQAETAGTFKSSGE